MKILVLSDSHRSLRFMRRCVKAVKPDAIIHLGDYYDDGQTLAEEYPQIAFYQVPGNCDEYCCPPFARETLIMPVCGVELFMTHGHIHRVKQTISSLLRDARAAKVQAVLYGHTHVPNCYQEPDGLWVLNPGSCGHFGNSAGLIQVQDKKITSCQLLRQEDLEVMK